MKSARMILVGALLSQAGVVAALTQCWAWASMVRGGQTVTQAVEGRRPCGLCLKLRNSKPANSLSASAGSPGLDWNSPASRPLEIIASSDLPARSFFIAVLGGQRIIDPPPPRLPLS